MLASSSLCVWVVLKLWVCWLWRAVRVGVSLGRSWAPSASVVRGARSVPFVDLAKSVRHFGLGTTSPPWVLRVSQRLRLGVNSRLGKLYEVSRRFKGAKVRSKISGHFSSFLGSRCIRI